MSDMSTIAAPSASGWDPRGLRSCGTTGAIPHGAPTLANAPVAETVAAVVIGIRCLARVAGSSLESALRGQVAVPGCAKAQELASAGTFAKRPQSDPQRSLAASDNKDGPCPFPAIASAEGQSKVIRLVRATASGNQHGDR